MRLGRLLGFILSTALVSLAYDAHADSDAQCSDFSYYVLSLEWPQSFCLKIASKQDCRIPESVTGWIVHGLWPHDSTPGKYPSYCAGPAYAEDDVADLATEQQTYWPDLLSHQDDASSSEKDASEADPFWSHEWQEHGTCALACDTSVSSQHDYFAMALDLTKKVDVGQALKTASIEPSDNSPVSGQSIIDAVKSASGVTPVVACYNDEDNNTSYLAEIRLCLKPDSHELIDCPPDNVSKHQICPATFIYPATSGQ